MTNSDGLDGPDLVLDATPPLKIVDFRSLVPERRITDRLLSAYFQDKYMQIRKYCSQILKRVTKSRSYIPQWKVPERGVFSELECHIAQLTSFSMIRSGLIHQLPRISGSLSCSGCCVSGLKPAAKILETLRLYSLRGSAKHSWRADIKKQDRTRWRQCFSTQAADIDRTKIQIPTPG